MMKNRTSIDIALPVLNEEVQLSNHVTQLNEFLKSSLFSSYVITIVDNGSTDATFAIATQLSKGAMPLRVIKLSQRGRGRALRAAWTSGEADIYAYMDIDLSTNLRCLDGIISPIVRNEADLTVGSRLISGSSVSRSVMRRCMSFVLSKYSRAMLGNRTYDCQCGFKAIRACSAKGLLSHVRDNNWFFDTELVTLAEHSGFRVLEVAVDWREDGGSTVRILPTIVEMICGVFRLRRRLKRSDYV